MSILDRIAQGNPDPGGSVIRGVLQGQQIKQRQDLFALKKMQVMSQLSERAKAVKTQAEAQAFMADIGTQLLRNQEGDQVDALRAQLGSGNPVLVADAWTKTNQLIGPEQLADTLVEAIDTETGQPVFTRAVKDREGVRTVEGVRPREKTGQTINVNTGEGALAKGDAKEVNTTVREQIRSSSDGLRQVAQMRRLLTTAKTGKLAEFQTEIGKLAEFAGVDPSRFGITSEQIAGNEAIGRLQFDMAAEIFANMKGAISDREFAAIMAGAPGVDKTEAGNARLLDLMEESMKFNREIATAQRKWFEQNGNLNGWIEHEQNVVDAFIARQTLPPGATLD